MRYQPQRWQVFYMRDPDLWRSVALQVGLLTVSTAVGFFVTPVAGAIMLATGAVYILIFLIFTIRRNNNISRLAQSIDRILHSQIDILPSESREGELAILKSEVTKMTVRLREQADALERDKLRLTDAIADISHQLRTPLTAMNLTISLLSEEDIDDERRLKLTRDLLRTLRRVDWLIEALLKMAKIDAGTAEIRCERVTVRELIRRALDPFRISMELRGQEVRVEASDVCYLGDMAWSVEAIGNILKNCMEHTPTGGCIEIKAAETALYTEIVIRDSGDGFAAEDIPHLFERFYKGKNADVGSVGIGLALARSVIAAQNGTVKAQNAKGGGAMFTVRFYKSVV